MTGLAALLAVAAPVGLTTANASGPSPQVISATSASVLPQRFGDVHAQDAGPAELARVLALATAPKPTTPPTTVAPAATVPPAPPTTAAPPPPAPVVQPVATGNGYNDPSNPAAWDRIAQCESGGNWALNTGNGYYGGIQFSLGSWQSVGGTGRPDQASRETQIAMGQRLYHSGGGWSHWPGCSRKLGYR